MFMPRNIYIYDGSESAFYLDPDPHVFLDLDLFF